MKTNECFDCGAETTDVYESTVRASPNNWQSKIIKIVRCAHCHEQLVRRETRDQVHVRKERVL